MVGKRLVVSLLTAFGLIFLCTGCLFKKTESDIKPEIETPKKIVQKTAMKPVPEVKKYDLYSSTPYDLPLFSIIEISKLPTVVKSIVDKILENSQGFYLLKCNQDKVFIILQTPVLFYQTYPRHELQIVEVSMDGRVTYHTTGYTGDTEEIFGNANKKLNSWILDESSETNRPLKHTAYDEKGRIKFVEIWSYEEKEPIKYQMTDSNKKIVSILKETHDNESNYRKEHIFYDNNGKIIMSLTINYEDANISRMTYYNAHESIESISILSEYTDGYKTKELIYNSDYELVNTITSDYKDSERINIKMYDSEGKEICKITS